MSREVKKLSIEEWSKIFDKLEQDMDEVEIMWLNDRDNLENGDWCLATHDAVFEQGYETEREAYNRLREIEDSLERSLVIK